ncbi:MAG TPA: peptide deformylase [Candidatus Saccharimonadales bacterium]|nr:peptide deformylase [Candidatus Saccharimonadales bacterium]
MPVRPGLLLPLDHYELTAGDKRLMLEEEALGLVPVDDPGLGQPAQPIREEALSSKVVQQAIERLRIAATGQRGSGNQRRRSYLMVGLAAPQVGVGLRIIVIDTEIQADRRKPGKLVYYINPKIVWRSRETEEGMEGCFSAGIVRGLVRRPIAVKIRAFTLEGKRIERIFEDFTARIVQHEIDHLDGVRFPDRIRSECKCHWVHTEELVAYRKAFRHWRRHCSQACWQALKQGKTLRGGIVDSSE